MYKDDILPLVFGHLMIFPPPKDKGHIHVLISSLQVSVHIMP